MGIKSPDSSESKDSSVPIDCLITVWDRNSYVVEHVVVLCLF